MKIHGKLKKEERNGYETQISEECQRLEIFVRETNKSRKYLPTGIGTGAGLKTLKRKRAVNDNPIKDITKHTAMAVVDGASTTNNKGIDKKGIR